MQAESSQYLPTGVERRSAGGVVHVLPAMKAVDPIERPPTVSVVIPALNEAENLPHVLPRIPTWVHEVILVDGGSADSTVTVAMEILPGIRIVHQTQKGKGNALGEGFRAATGDIIVMIDADGSTDPTEIPRFLSALRTGADFVKGTRYVQGGGSADLTPIRTAGNRALTGMVNLFWHTKYTDLCYGYIAFWSRHLELLAPDCRGFEVETLLCIRAVERGLQVSEVVSFEASRISGTSNLRATRDGFRILRTIVAELVRPW